MRHWSVLLVTMVLAGLWAKALCQTPGPGATPKPSTEQAAKAAEEARAEAQRRATMANTPPLPSPSPAALSAADIKTAEDLRKAGAAYALDKPFPIPSGAAPSPPRPYLWIADFIGSKDTAIRDAAAEIVATSMKPFDGGMLTPYFTDRYPLNVRMAVAVWVSPAWQATPAGAAAYRSMQLQTFKLLTAPVAPPYTANVLHTYRTLGMSDLPKDQQRILIRRTLAVVSKTNMLPDYGEVTTWASRPFGGLDGAILGEELAAWYKIEPTPAVRRWLLGPEGLSEKPYKPVYEVGTQDPDEANAALAKKKLQRLPAN